MTHNAIQAEALSKRFGQLVVLNQVHFTVEPASIAVLVGGNGAGKSTLVHLLAGLSRPTDGSVTLFGRRPPIQGEMGVLFEVPHLYPHLSAAKNLSLLAGQNVASEKEHADVLSRLGLSNDILRRRGRYLSFGQRRKVTLAALFSSSAKILIIDEPTNGLDPQSVEVVRDLIFEARDRGQAAFVTGQDIDLLNEVADTVLTLHDGSIEQHLEWRESRIPQHIELSLRASERLPIINWLDAAGVRYVLSESERLVIAGDADDVRGLAEKLLSNFAGSISDLQLRDRDLRNLSRGERR